MKMNREPEPGPFNKLRSRECAHHNGPSGQQAERVLSLLVLHGLLKGTAEVVMMGRAMR